MMQGRAKNAKTPASEMLLGDLPIGSLASRAAARALLTARVQNAKKLDFVVTVVGYSDRFNPPTIGKWSEGPDGTLTRISRIPWGMTIEEAERMVK